MRAFTRRALGLLTAAAFLLGSPTIVGSWRVSATSLHHRAYTFVTFDDPRGVGTTLWGINDAGQAVGFYTDRSKAVHAFVITARTRTFAGSKHIAYFSAPQGLQNTSAFSINDAGQIVGSYFDSAHRLHGYVRSPDGKSYAVVNDPRGAYTNMFGINRSGQVSGFFVDKAGGAHGFVRSADGKTFTNFDNPRGIVGKTYATAINNAGEIVGHYFDQSGFHGFVRSADGKAFTDFDVTKGDQTCGQDINDEDWVDGFFYDSLKRVHGFIRSLDGKSVIVIDDPQGVGKTQLFGINNLGQVVGQYVDAKGLAHGFIASPAG